MFGPTQTNRPQPPTTTVRFLVAVDGEMMIDISTHPLHSPMPTSFEGTCCFTQETVVAEPPHLKSAQERVDTNICRTQVNSFW